MTDIVHRLSMLAAKDPRDRCADAMLEAAQEILSLRSALARIADQDATFSVIGGNIVVDVDATLTNDERAAILASEGWWALEQSPHADTLRGLLQRTDGVKFCCKKT